ncbi:MAG TPA: response regulator transcription factor [Candidatus Limnocylindrales bacterium]|nr:response regulator transcription factor [Candidatus Limnocylindrales bacterium]
MSAASAHVLVVEDEAPIASLVHGYFVREGWTVTTARDGSAALDAARRDPPDVVVLDLMLPGIDGLEVCRQLRGFSDACVIILTAMAEEADKLVGFAAGADDYLTKPFSPRELVVRVRALLRRTRALRVTATGLEVDGARRTATVDGRRVKLTRTEFDLLALLARAPGVVMDRAAMLAAVWGAGYDDGHLVDVHVANLRRKLGDDPDRPRFVETVRGIGFRLVVD